MALAGSPARKNSGRPLLASLVEAAKLSGEILFEGETCSRCRFRLHGLRGRDIAVIFQEPMPALNPVFTVGDQIAESLQLHEGLNRDQAGQEP